MLFVTILSVGMTRNPAKGEERNLTHKECLSSSVSVRENNVILHMEVGVR